MNSSFTHLSQPQSIIVDLRSDLIGNRNYVVVRSADGYAINTIDSGIPGCRWHRISVDADIPDDASVNISFSASDSSDSQPGYGGALLFSGVVRDGYIESCVGQYLFIRAVISGAATLGKIKIYYPRITYLQYLPETYSEDDAGRDFLERSLSLFESILTQSSERITDIPSFFDPQTREPSICAPLSSSEEAKSQWLTWLARWVSLDLYDVLGEKGNREYISKASESFRKKGTLAGLGRLVEFLTGAYGKVKIKEYANTVFRSWGLEHLKGSQKDMPESPSPYQCRPFYKTLSTTVNAADPNDPNLLSDMDTLNDRIHYTTDARDISVKDNQTIGIHARHVIGIFIFLAENDSLILSEDLKKIINSFLPVFVRAAVKFVVPTPESYPYSGIMEVYVDRLIASDGENYYEETGTYEDATNWKVLYANIKEELTNEREYRSWHSTIGRQLPI